MSTTETTVDNQARRKHELVSRAALADAVRMQNGSFRGGGGVEDILGATDAETSETGTLVFEYKGGKYRIPVLDDDDILVRGGKPSGTARRELRELFLDEDTFRRFCGADVVGVVRGLEAGQRLLPRHYRDDVPQAISGLDNRGVVLMYSFLAHARDLLEAEEDAS